LKKEDYIINGYSLEHIRNRNEVEVIKAMKDVIEEFPDFCGCSLCLEDVYALSLNMLPTKYVQHSSILFPKDKTPQDEIEYSVSQAVERVMKNPSHRK